jgi:pimeloyl-ACP methyl ester carboxylesterase
MANKRIYLLPGRGESLGAGLGRLITKMGYSIQGREIVSYFARLRFAEQLALIRSDLDPDSWNTDARLIGRSYGAYLLLHTLADMEHFPGKILLCSPVLGAAIAQNGFYGSRPPRAEKLLKITESSEFPAPSYMEIHTGAEDNGCDPLLAKHLASLIPNTTLETVPGAGHDLGEDYTRGTLREFLCDELDSASIK